MPAGRPSKYEELDLKKVEKLAGYGLTDVELADFLGIHRDTIYEWKNVHPEFSDTLKRGKLKADLKVVKSLFKRANGFTYTEVTKEGEKETKKVTKEVVPDTTAAIFWLKNRRSEEWRDKQEVEHSGEIKKTIKIGYGEKETE